MVVSWPCLVAPFKSLHKNWTLELSDVNHRMCKTWIWESEDESFRSDRIRPVWAKGGWPGNRYFLSAKTFFLGWIQPCWSAQVASLHYSLCRWQWAHPSRGWSLTKYVASKNQKMALCQGFWESQRHHTRMSHKGKNHISVDISDVGTIIITTTSPKLLKSLNDMLPILPADDFWMFRWVPTFQPL